MIGLDTSVRVCVRDCTKLNRWKGGGGRGVGQRTLTGRKKKTRASLYYSTALPIAKNTLYDI